MLAQTDAERERYEARRKWQLDYNTGLKVARMEGREEGREVGAKIGVIQLCEESLGLPPMAPALLDRMSLEELTRLADALQEQLRKRL